MPYFSAFQNLGLLEEILVGQIPVRYNRHKDRMYLDMDWNITNVGDVIVAEAYQIVDSRCMDRRLVRSMVTGLCYCIDQAPMG